MSGRCPAATAFSGALAWKLADATSFDRAWEASSRALRSSGHEIAAEAQSLALRQPRRTWRFFETFVTATTTCAARHPGGPDIKVA
jgi:hypothetical protein